MPFGVRMVVLAIGAGTGDGSAVSTQSKPKIGSIKLHGMHSGYVEIRDGCAEYVSLVLEFVGWCRKGVVRAL